VAGLVLHGETVVLRPLREDEFPIVRAAFDDPAYGGFPPDETTDGRVRERIARSGRDVDGFLDLGIEVDGRLVGDVGARHPFGATPPGVFELGITIFAGADRGRGIGREAVELLTEHLFAEGAERVQATTAVENAAMRGVFRRLGFAEEGVLRAFLPGHAGGRVDAVMCAVTRDDWRPRVTP
jgi:RimJ/RimL family protein N-acetyltransferase